MSVTPTTTKPETAAPETQSFDDLYDSLIGRQVLFYPAEELFSAEIKNSGASFLGFICHVQSDSTVTLACFDRAGQHFPADAVPLVQEPSEDLIATGHFAILRD